MSASENVMVGDLIASSPATLLAIQTERASRIRRVIEHLAMQGGRAYFHWHPETGLTRNTGQRRSTSSGTSLPHFLLQIEDIILDAVYVIEDASLEDDSVEPLLRALVERLAGTPSTVVLLSGQAIHLPESLSSVALVINPDGQRSQIEACTTPLSQRLVGQRVMTIALAKEERARLQESLQNQDAAKTPSKQVYHSKASGVDNWKAVSGALAPHAQAVQEASFLEYFSPEKCQLGLPGFHRLRQEVGLNESWLIDGATGCGRSLVPFVAAEALDCGVNRLDGAGLVAQGALCSDRRDPQSVRSASSIHVPGSDLVRSNPGFPLGTSPTNRLVELR